MLGGNAAFDPAATWLIQRVAGTGSSGTITFSSIPQNYKHLQLRIFTRLVSGQSNPTLTFNSDTGSNYARHLLSGDGATVTASGGSSLTSISSNLRAISTADTGVANIIDIHDYASTTKNKTVRIFTAWDANGSGSVRLASGLWMNTNAISTITIDAGAGNSFATNATFALYGMVG
jgi:hypothetical protein